MSVDANKKQLFSILTLLLYPAILGAVIYDAWKLFFFDVNKHPTVGLVFLVLALIALYVVDFSYTVVREEKTYASKQFLSDCVIVFCLFFATKLVLAGIPEIDPNESFRRSFPGLAEWRIPFIYDPLFWLVLTKFFSVVWEIFEQIKDHEAEQEKREKENKPPARQENFFTLTWNMLADTITLSRFWCKPVNGVVCGRPYNEEELTNYGIGTDAIFMFAYLLSLWWWWGYLSEYKTSWLDGNYPQYVWMIALIAILDTLMYWRYDRLDKALR